LRPRRRQFHGHGGGQRDALVGWAEQHVEGHAAGEQRVGIEAGQAAKLGAVVEQAGVEKIRRVAPGLGDEGAEADDAAVDCKAQKVLGESG
jgi:hypothetical protein